MEKKDILNIMKEFYDNGNLKLPKQIDMQVTGNKCVIMLDEKKVKEENMQKDCNAFEGWSIAVYTALKKKYDNIIVELGIKNQGTKTEEFNGHWARFLYRAARFREQYEWFSLNEGLASIIETEEKRFKKNEYTNNIPKNEAGIKENHNNENVIEAYLAKEGKLKEVIGNQQIFDGEEVYRQLPVGLFRSEIKKSNAVFTSGKSAIDLWSWKDDTFYAVELKTKNPMLGIITEIFFYANYMYDLLVKKTFVLNQKPMKETANDRGYHILLEHKMKKVSGIMLADRYHPVLENKEVLDVMNDNGNRDIHYDKTDYKYQLDVRKKE